MNIPILFSCVFSIEAPIALDPIPASHANATFLTSFFGRVVSVAAAFFSSPGALWLSTNWLMSIPATSCSSSGVLSLIKKNAVTAKDTTVAIK